jgi:hypothetical protein
MVPTIAELVDQHVDADMDPGPHAIGGAELRHPDEHVDAQLLRPGDVNGDQVGVEKRHAGSEPVHDGNKDQDGRCPHQARDDDLLQPVENPQKHQCPL